MNLVSKAERDGKFLLGVTPDGEYLYMDKFSWDCGWYWGGGYLWGYRRNNRHSSSMVHFDSIFFKGNSRYVGMDDNLRSIDVVHNLKKSALTNPEWWRLMDLMKQFYTLKECAEVYQYGGHYSSSGRTEAEIDVGMAKIINMHIQDVIIPEVYKIIKPSEE